VRRAVEDAVAALGLSVAAGACECTPAELSDAVTGRKGRRLPFEWVLAIAMVAGPDDRQRIAAALLDELGLVPAAPKPLDGEAYSALLERRVAEQLGPAGAAVVRESRREARR
jgi:hypothetical protein